EQAASETKVMGNCSAGKTERAQVQLELNHPPGGSEIRITVALRNNHSIRRKVLTKSVAEQATKVMGNCSASKTERAQVQLELNHPAGESEIRITVDLRNNHSIRRKVLTNSVAEQAASETKGMGNCSAGKTERAQVQFDSNHPAGGSEIRITVALRNNHSIRRKVLTKSVAEQAASETKVMGNCSAGKTERARVQLELNH